MWSDIRKLRVFLANLHRFWKLHLHKFFVHHWNFFFNLFFFANQQMKICTFTILQAWWCFLYVFCCLCYSFFSLPMIARLQTYPVGLARVTPRFTPFLWEVQMSFDLEPLVCICMLLSLFLGSHQKIWIENFKLTDSSPKLEFQFG